MPTPTSAARRGATSRSGRLRGIRSVAIATTAMVALTGTTACEVVEEGDFSFLTYNVAGLPQEISTEHPGVNIPLISPKLNPFDVVVTQEDFDWWDPALNAYDFANYHTRLRAQATHAHTSGVHPGPAAVGITGSDPERPVPFVGDGLGVMSRFPITTMERIPWEHCFGGADQSDGGAADCLAMKGIGFTTVTLASGVEVDVYTVHGEAGRTPTDNRMIAEDFDLLADVINERSHDRPVILGGDTNLHTAPGHVMAPVHTPIWNTFLAATGLADVCSYVSCVDPGSLDKVAFRGAGSVTLHPVSRSFEDDVFVDGSGQDLSDHLPVSVQWHWARWG